MKALLIISIAIDLVIIGCLIRAHLKNNLR